MEGAYPGEAGYITSIKIKQQANSNEKKNLKREIIIIMITLYHAVFTT
jgi:hypothetical protein